MNIAPTFPKKRQKIINGSHCLVLHKAITAKAAVLTTDTPI